MHESIYRKMKQDEEIVAAGEEEAVIHEAGEIYRAAAGTSPVVVEAGDDSDGIRFALEHSDKPTQKKVAEEVSRGKTGTPEQIAEAQRQYDEVVSRYTNPDGTRAAGWLKAPNGKPTKLTERQWAQVRTPLFKKWFGDWETAARAEFYENGVSQNEAETRLNALLKNGKPALLYNSDIKDSANFSKSSIGKLLSEEAVNKSVKNGFTRQQHYAAASDIQYLFSSAVKLIERPDRNNDPNVKAIIRFGSPVIINGKKQLAFITVKESVQHGKRIYSTELMEIKKLDGNLEEADTAHFPTSSKIKLQQAIDSVNLSDVSAVRDAETGEPLAVYHGTSGSFDTFDRSMIGQFDNGLQRTKDTGFFFDEDKENARQHSEGAAEYLKGKPRIIEAFLNIRNPLIEKEDKFYSERKYYTPQNWYDRERSVILPRVTGENDGILVQDDFRNTSMQIAFKPEQIKSATDNAGTFGGDTGSILYSLEESDNAGMDAERAARIKAITPKTYDPAEGVDKKKVEDIFRNFTPLQKDGMNISFPVGTVGKLYGLGGTKYMYLAPAIREMLDGSIYAYSSNYISEKARQDGSAHKTHTNIEQYHNYVNKIKTDKEYYIRFTVQELKHPKQRKGELHSGYLTEVSLYDEKGNPLTSGNSPGGTGKTPIDKRLADFFNSVKNKDFDPETSPENDSGLLFQLTRAEEVEEARESVRRGRSREEFIGDRLESGAEAGDDAPGGAADKTGEKGEDWRTGTNGRHAV